MSAPMENPVTINGFTVIQVKFDVSSQACHCLYLKGHNVRQSNDTKPKERTLFILNIPPYVNEACLERLFSDCGTVENVYLQDKPSSQIIVNEKTLFESPKPNPGFKVAFVVFRKAASVQKAQKLLYSKERILSTEEFPIVTGIKKWCKEYAEQAPDTKLLQSDIDTYMAEYDDKIKEEEIKAKESEGVPDEDGWVTVTKHGKNKGIPRTEVQVKKVNTREKKRRKEKELLNFYAFQIRESKREHLANLREKFEEDKQKIQLMRAARKFKPY